MKSPLSHQISMSYRVTDIFFEKQDQDQEHESLLVS